VPPADHRITLLSKAQCHLCDEARRDIARVAADLGVGWQEIDIATDDELLLDYADRVPVILLDGAEHSSLYVEEDRLRAALRS
jgi:glutaredoxin